MAMDFGIKNLYYKSLEAIALRKVAILLCSRPRVFMRAAILKEEREADFYAKANKFLIEKVAELQLPASQKKELVSLLTLLLIELRKWLRFHEEYLTSSLSNRTVLKYIHWNECDMGTINYQKTAETLIRLEKLTIDDRYMLACLYCFEPCIRDLWPKVSDDYKEYLYTYPIDVHETPVISMFWTFKLGGRIDMLYEILYHRGYHRSSVYQFAFEATAFQGLRSAAQYFFEKLTSEEKKDSLIRIASAIAERPLFLYDLNLYEAMSDVLEYLISLMNEAQVMYMIHNHPYGILKCFLDRSRQHAFLYFAKRAVLYLSSKKYSEFLCHLTEFSSRYNYRKMFREFFLMSPRGLRSFALIHYAQFLQELLENGDEETIKFIFRNLKSHEKWELALSKDGLSICFDLINQDKWDSVELLFQDVKLSKVKIYIYYLSFSSQNKISIKKLLAEKGKWTWFLQLTKDSKVDEETPASLIQLIEKELKDEPTERPPKKLKNV